MIDAVVGVVIMVVCTFALTLAIEITEKALDTSTESMPTPSEEKLIKGYLSLNPSRSEQELKADFESIKSRLQTELEKNYK